MPVALKATWTVTAGLFPGHVIPEDTRQWLYTSDDFEVDAALPQDQPTKFSAIDTEAHQYARQLTDPRHCNHVKLEFLWV